MLLESPQLSGALAGHDCVDIGAQLPRNNVDFIADENRLRNIIRRRCSILGGLLELHNYFVVGLVVFIWVFIVGSIYWDGYFIKGSITLFCIGSESSHVRNLDQFSCVRIFIFGFDARIRIAQILPLNTSNFENIDLPLEEVLQVEFSLPIGLPAIRSNRDEVRRVLIYCHG